MNCAACNTPLEPRHRTQRHQIRGLGPQPSFCDDCLRASTWRGGEKGALERLVTGRIDEAAAQELAAMFPSVAE